jgi:SAM-dependent methyltransferase
MTIPFDYVGGELHLFREAHHWKRYWRSQAAAYIHGDVLEVGAGIGGTTRVLHDAACASWTCLEPDQKLVAELTTTIAPLRDRAGRPPRVMVGGLTALPAEQRFDAILYVDVLEHIEDDAREIATAADKLRSGGHVIVLAPAHQWLFTPFDQAIGHFRRYDRRSIRRCTPASLRLERFRYLDCVGIVASLGNRLVTRASMPTARQIRTWDDWMIPLSRWLDPVLAYRLGKSVLAVWTR